MRESRDVSKRDKDPDWSCSHSFLDLPLLFAMVIRMLKLMNSMLLYIFIHFKWYIEHQNLLKYSVSVFRDL